MHLLTRKPAVQRARAVAALCGLLVWTLSNVGSTALPQLLQAGRHSRDWQRPCALQEHLTHTAALPWFQHQVLPQPALLLVAEAAVTASQR
jgi:hypothetical protein